MRGKYSLLMLLISGVILITGGGCNSDKGGPKALLEKYFSSAVKQDYSTSYDCYYGAYKEKVNKEEYIKHRKEASSLQAYRIASLEQNGDTAHAEVLLTFSPSEKLKRKEAVSTTVKEDLVKEGGEWKIKVW